MTLRYHLLDVFTDRVFGGNPLAVFPDAPLLEPAAMQRIAGELGLSESVFVTTAARLPARHRVWIYTPRMELPFAGHPTIGTAALLADLGLAPEASFTLEETAGMVPVTVQRRAGLLSAQLRVPETPRVGPPPPARADLAAMLGLEPDDIAPVPDAPCAATAGVPYLIIPVRDVATLGRVHVDVNRWERLLSRFWAPHIYVVCHSGERELRARMFAPAMGIAEDPATGAGAVALPAYLSLRTTGSTGRQEWTIWQGIEMGRPSRMELTFDATPAGPQNVELGGSVVRVGEGTLYRV